MMHYLMAIILFIHGTLHLPGFFKAYELIPVDAIRTSISRSAGLIWLTASLLFDLAATLLIIGISFWWVFGFTALILSQLLIIRFWTDAKFGSIINLIIAVMVFSGYSGEAYQKKLTAEKAHFIEMAEISHNLKAYPDKLPLIIQKWLKNSGADSITAPAYLVLTQDLQLKTDRDQKEWDQAEAVQLISITEPAFLWNMTMNRRLITITGRDKYMDQHGDMEIRINNFPVVDEYGPKTTEASLQRYLAEIVWAPWSAASHHIRWIQFDSLTAEALITDSELKTKGTFIFNENGDVRSFRALRYRHSDDEAEREEWIIDLLKYESMKGIRIPVLAEVSWKTEGDKQTWLRLRIRDIKLIH
ncbi:DUF6544 family protein [Balneola sp. MJW-20]|uniref:DUF6544 family protein n=1 Tax=Gracilimonas aurantiaca TaxID=3234185 RepID=UPI0034666B62